MRAGVRYILRKDVDDYGGSLDKHTTASNRVKRGEVAGLREDICLGKEDGVRTVATYKFQTINYKHQYHGCNQGKPYHDL